MCIRDRGYISQNTDNIKIMYSIPALQGSSGSPVVNQYGELVAINFAGINGTQGFNYGIRVERLRAVSYTHLDVYKRQRFNLGEYAEEAAIIQDEPTVQPSVNFLEANTDVYKRQTIACPL